MIKKIYNKFPPSVWLILLFFLMKIISFVYVPEFIETASTYDIKLHNRINNHIFSFICSFILICALINGLLTKVAFTAKHSNLFIITPLIICDDLLEDLMTFIPTLNLKGLNFINPWKSLEEYENYLSNFEVLSMILSIASFIIIGVIFFKKGLKEAQSS
jgi:hypothetical protein